MKDNFSAQSDQYKSYRPVYPQKLYRIILSEVSDRKCAWDCGTGNGQAAKELAKYFKKVYATDISRQQLSQAPQIKNIEYSVQQAETTTFSDNQFDLVNTAQAIHWFRFDEFYNEVYRTLKNNGVFSVIGYGLIRTFPEADQIISHFYQHIVGPFWDEERKYVDKKYQTIPFPFDEIKSGELQVSFEWNIEQLTGYLGTWSAVQHYRDEKNSDPLNLIYDDLAKCWKSKKRTVRFPVFYRLARISK